MGDGRQSKGENLTGCKTACQLPSSAAVRRTASLSSERLIAALTLALEADVVDRLMVKTMACEDDLVALSGLETTPLVAVLRAEKAAEYRRLVAETATVIGSKAECYSVLRGGR